MVATIKQGDEVIAIILRKKFSKYGANFFTFPNDPLQFGVLRYEKGKCIPAHKHVRIKRDIDLICEVLIVLEGRVKVTFYNDCDKRITSRILKAGDAILMKNAGHSFKLLDNAKIIEVKQGPYLGKDKDKVYLNI
jgi:mannose-6-phosphate isomerase-like protein (cupin superfamily)